MSEPIRRIAILGAGSWGTALATLLGAADSVRLWARSEPYAEAIQAARQNARYLPGIPLPANLTATADLDAALRDVEAVVLAVPSGAMREVALDASRPLGEAQLIVSAAKGLDSDTGHRMSEVIGSAAPGAAGRVVALSGPNLALEVARGTPTATVAASADADAARACQTLFMGPAFRVYTSGDLVGVELAGAMKNVIAIGSGVCEGMGFGDNTRAALMTRGLAEITRLGVALGARTETFLGLAGVGDLIATGGSRLSRNYRVGIGLGQGRPLEEILRELGQVAEGVPTTHAICLLAARSGVEMPISEALRAALFEGASIRDSITALMLRPAKGESLGGVS